MAAFSDKELRECREWVDSPAMTKYFGDVPVYVEQKMKDMADRFLDTIDELKSMVDFWEKVSERRYSVYAKLGRIWARAVGKEGTIPDTGKLLDWLAEYIEQLETALEKIEQKTEGADEDEPPKSLLVLFLEINDIARKAREGGKK